MSNLLKRASGAAAGSGMRLGKFNSIRSSFLILPAARFYR
jgi:hypothetical protein